MEKRDNDNRILLIVDPQIDFITGSLPVPGAVDAMDALASYVRDFGHLYDVIVVTCDRHPLNHSSFREAGGQWPPHCVESSVGAAVWPAVLEQLTPFASRVRFLYKGEDPARDEYSVFQSDKGARDMDTILRSNDISRLDICGLAGDVCVKTTLMDAVRLYPDIHYRILTALTASLDGGQAIASISA